VLIIVQPGTEAFHPAVLLSLGCAVFTAIYMLLTRKLAGVDSTKTQQFYASGVATVCIAPFAFGAFLWPATPVQWFAFILIGVAALVGHLFITTAHRFAPATVLAPFGYFQIIYMTAASWVIFNQPPSIWIYVGAPIVIASGLYIWLRERQLSKSVVTEVTTQD
jgi:drug/metabolite transporter (DMT)-like permease